MGQTSFVGPAAPRTSISRRAIIFLTLALLAAWLITTPTFAQPRFVAPDIAAPGIRSEIPPAEPPSFIVSGLDGAAVSDIVFTNPKLETVDLPYQPTSSSVDPAAYQITSAGSFQPGKYLANATIVRNGVEQKVREEFLWGVVAVNVRRSINQPDRETKIEVAVLDDFGRTVCDSDVEVKVTDPDDGVQVFTTSDGTVQRNPDCRDHSVTNDPDYEVKYSTGREGTYRIEVTASSPDGARSVTDVFTVQADPAFDIERSEFPTRIYPPADYPVSFTITPKSDFQGTVEEAVPAAFNVFDISSGGRTISSNDVTIIQWSVDWRAGRSYTLTYAFKAPNISPLLHRLGPLIMYSRPDTAVFSEARSWQIAADATKTWDGGAADAFWSSCDNWDNNTCPSAVTPDAIVFDGTSNDDSDWDAGSSVTSIASLSVTSMSGSLTFTKTPVTVTGNFTHSSTGNVIFASSVAISVGGDFTLTTSGTLTQNTSTLTMTGTSNSFNTAKTLNSLTIDPSSVGTISVVTNSPTVAGTLTVAANDTLSIGSGLSVTYSGTSDMALTGTVSGDGMIVFPSGSGGPGTAGTLTAWTRFDATGGNVANTTIDARNNPAYGGTVEFYTYHTSLRALTMTSGTYTFSSNFYINAANNGGVSVSASVNNPTVSIAGDFDFTGIGAGSESIVMGTNSWTVSGDFNVEDGTTATIRTLILNGAGKNLKLNGKNIVTLLQISGTITMTSTDGTIGTAGSLTVDSGKTLTIDAGRTLTLTRTSGATLSLTGIINGTGTLIYKTSTTFPTGGTISCPVQFDATTSAITLSARTYGGAVEFYNNSTTSRDFTLGDGASQTLAFSGDFTLNAPNTANVQVTAAVNDPIITIGEDIDFTGSGGGTEIILSGTSAWTVSGNADFTGGTYTHEDNNTLTMNGATKTLTSNSNILYNFTVSSGSVTISDTTDIDNDLTISGGTLTAPATLTLGGSFDNDAAFVHSSGTITFDATATTETIDGDGTGSEAFYNVIFNDAGGSAEFQMTAAMDADNDLTITGGNFNANSNSLTIGGSFDNDDTFTSGTQTTTFNAATGNKTIDADGTGTEAFSSVVFNDSVGSATFQLTTAIDIDADLTITGGTFNANSQSVTVGGNWDNNDLFTSGTQTVTFDATDAGNTVEAGSSTFSSVTFSGAGGGNGTWTVQTNDMTVNSAIDVDTGDEVAIAANKTLTLGSGATTLTLDGTISGSGTLTYKSSNNFPSGATGGVISADLLYNCTNNDQMLRVRSYGGDVTVQNDSVTDERTVTTNTDSFPISIAGDFALSAGNQNIIFDAATFDMDFTIGGSLLNTGSKILFGVENLDLGDGTWTVSGDVDFSDTNVTAASSILIMDGTGGRVIYPDGESLYDFTVDPASADTVYMSTGDLTVTNTLTIGAGDALDIEIDTTLTHTGATLSWGDGSSTISGDGTLRFTNASGGPGTGGTISSITRYDASSANIASTTFDARTYSGLLELYSNSGTAKTVSCADASTYILSGASASLNLMADSDGSLSLLCDTATDPTVTIGGDIDYTGVGGGAEAITSGTGTWTVSGNVNFTDGTYTATAGNTLIMNGTGTLTSDSEALQNLTLSGTITLANATHTVAGNLSLAGGTITAGSSTITMTGTSNTITGGGQTLYNLTINPASAGTITVSTSDLTVAGALNVADSDTLSIASDRTVTLSANSGTSLTLNTSGTVSGAGRLTYQNSATTITTAGTISAILRFDTLNGNMTMPSARSTYGPVELYNNTGSSQQILGQAGTYTLSGAGSYLYLIANGTGNITLDATNGGTVNPAFAIGGDLDFTGTDLTGAEAITSGTGTWTVSGNVNFTDGTYTATAGNTLIMNGTGTLTSDSEALQNLTLSGTITLANATHTVAGNLSLAGGTITAGSSTITMTGTSNTITGGGQTLYNLTINPASAGTITAQTSDLSVSNVLDVADGDTLSIDSDRTVTTTATSGASVTLNTSGTLAGLGRLTYRSSTVFPYNGTVNCILRFDATYVDMNFRAKTYGYNVELVNLSASRDASFTSSTGATVVTGSLTFITASRNISWSSNNQYTVGVDVARTGGGAGQVEIHLGGDWYVSGNFNLTGIIYSTDHFLYMNGTGAQLTSAGNSLNYFTVYGGSVSIMDTTDIDANVTINSGSLTAPATLTVGGSWDNNATFLHNSGTVTFDADAIGKTIEAGASSFNNVIFNNAAGGWTIQTDDMTTAGNCTLTAAAAFTVASGRVLQVQGNYSQAVVAANTTWTGSTLYLNGSGGMYDINAKTHGGDTYATVRVGASEDIAMWDASASTYTIDSGGCLFSEDHGATAGRLNVYGTCNSRSNEYWSYATDFDGAALAGASRQADVRFADTATLTVDNGDTLAMLGQSASANRTLVTRQASGTYGIAISGTINAQYYDFDYLNASGLNITSTATVTELSDGSFDNAGAGSANYITVAGITSTKAFSNNVFDDNADGADSNVTVNVNGDGAGIKWMFLNHSGNKSGEAYDAEANGAVINWQSNLSFSVSDTAMNLGILNPYGIGQDSHTITVTTDAELGYTCKVVEDDNLSNGAAIISDVADGTVTAGDEEYGLSCSGGGCQLGGDNPISGSPLTVASSVGPASSEITTMTYSAAVNTTTVGTDYSHIVTYTCTGNF